MKIERKEKRRKIMLLILGSIAVLVISIMIWFNIPYSPTHSDFQQITANQIAKTKTDDQNQIFTEEDIANLPESVKKHFRYCGYVGKPKMANMKIFYNDVDFVQAGKKFKIKYIQYNFADEPVRVAYIDTSMFGVPFEGMDTYYNGEGSMKGVLAKCIPLFNQKGPFMDKSSLVTCLAESLLIPNLALQDFIIWEEINSTHVKATMYYYGITVGGIFEFGENGEMICFTTNDREYVDSIGKTQTVKWSAVCGDYKESGGIMYPTFLKAIWHFESGDLVYFDGKDFIVEYDVTK